MKKLFLFISFFICIFDARAQVTFNKHFDTDSLSNLLGTSSFCENSTGYLVGSSITNISSLIGKLLFVQIDFNGDTLWTKSYGQQGIEYFGFFRGLFPAKSGSGYVFGGSIHNYSTDLTDAYVGKANDLGDTLWTKRIRISDKQTGVTQLYYTSAGEYALSGIRYI
jgi:hypothetical protein